MGKRVATAALAMSVLDLRQVRKIRIGAGGGELREGLALALITSP